MKELTVKETEDQEESDRNNYRYTFNVDHLDCENRGGREHHGCDGESCQMSWSMIQ